MECNPQDRTLRSAASGGVYVLGRRLALDVGQPFLIQDINTDTNLHYSCGSYLDELAFVCSPENDTMKACKLQSPISSMTGYSRIVASSLMAAEEQVSDSHQCPWLRIIIRKPMRSHTSSIGIYRLKPWTTSLPVSLADRIVVFFSRFEPHCVYTFPFLQYLLGAASTS
ncbi:hypothetical protein BJX99DRAFT_257332 [Aspergillus californicus]